MPNEEEMTLEEQKEYLRVVSKRDLKASTPERGRCHPLASGERTRPGQQAGPTAAPFTNSLRDIFKGC